MGEVMNILLDNDEPDILIPCEGTYPYVRGGVASWIAQLITGLPQYKFGIAFIGSKKQDYPSKPLYDFPANLVYVVELFMFDEEEKPKIKATNGSLKNFEDVERLYQWFKNDNQKTSFPSDLKNLDFFLKKID